MKLTFTKKKLLLLVAGMLGTASLSQTWSQTTCGSATIPATMNTVSADSFICTGGNVGLSLSPTISNGGTSVTYQWQYATNAAGPWTNLGTASTTATYLDMNVTANRFYRCLINCNNTLATTSSTASTVVTTPQAPTVVAGSRCGPGTVTLSGTPTTGASLQWYAAATGGVPLGSGNTFTTPYITQNTTYYASSNIGGSAPATWVGTATTTTTGSTGNPFYTTFWGNKQQYLYTAAELNALGLTGGAILDIAFDVSNIGTMNMNNFTIKMGHTTATGITAFVSNLTQVYTTPVYSLTTTGVKVFTLQNPFVWDGVSNIVLETCFNNTAWSGGHGVKYHTTTGTNKSLYYYADASGVCANTAGSTTTYRPNTRFNISAGCASARVPVVATVTPAPALDITVDSVICNDITKAITLTTPAANFDQYTWAPVTNLYTDAAGTIPYITGTSASTVYVRTANSGALTYTVSAHNTTTSCTAADTVNTFVQPGNITISALLDTLCVSGNPQLSLVPSGSYKPNSIQWQVQSGATFNNIAGATGNTYTTTTAINAATTYQALIKAVGTATCATPQKTIQVANPVLTSSTGATRCGPGSVTLSAQATVGTVTWYQNVTGGIALGTGNNYTTPYIPTTTNYYVTATTDLALPPTWVGTGTASNTGSDGNPFYTTFWGNKQQYIYTAADLLAMGLTPGVITAVGFDVVSNTGLPMANFTIKMKQITGTTFTGANYEMTGLTQVYTTPLLTPTIGVNNFVLTTPFVWDGSSSLVLETCFNNTSWSGGHGIKYHTVTSGKSLYQYADNATVCASTTGYNGSYRPNTMFTMIGKCELPRVPVVATITPGPALVSSVDSTICGNSIKAMSVTTPVGNYNQYVWSPTTDLYTNAAATTPYVAGTSASTVYVKSSTAGPKEYYLAASNPTCTGADTNKTWIQPSVVEVDAFPDTICISGSTDLSLIPANLYAPNSIQWQTNASGSYVNVATGGTTQTYTTPTINVNTGYRAQIKAMGNVCLNADKTVVIADPTLLSYADSFNCGPGSVTLAATAGGNGVPKWYDVPMGGLALGTGNTFNTPPLSATQTFYVEAGMGGGGSGSPTWLGTATTTTTAGTGNPFYTFYYGTKQQYLYTAAELSALGLGAGSILEIGFYVASTGGINMTNFTIKMGQTTATGLTAFVTNLTQVYTTPVLSLTATGERVFTLQNPYVWDGVSNLIVETCFNNTTWSSAHGVRYHTVPSTQSRYYYADNATVCSNTAGTATTYRPNTLFKIQGGCTTNRVAVIAEIRETPTVSLGADRNICDDVNGEALLTVNTQPAGATYQWDNNVTTPDRTITASGTYYVDVTNSVGCTERDSVTINLLESPMVNLPDSTRICIGGNTVLNPGNSGNPNTQYYWSTGSSQDSITVNSGGTYIVYATNPNNCSNSDTIVVVEEGYMPALSYVMSQNLGSNTFSFNVVGAQNVISYHWDFGDGSTSNAANPTHTFANVGTYFVTVRLNSICGEVNGSSSIHILTSTGIKDVEADKYVKLYPNPNKGEVVYLELINDVKITALEIYNVVGQRIVVMNNFQPGSDKYTIALPAHLASGIYNVKMETSKGTLTKKLEIIK